MDYDIKIKKKKIISIDLDRTQNLKLNLVKF